MGLYKLWFDSCAIQAKGHRKKLQDEEPDLLWEVKNKLKLLKLKPRISNCSILVLTSFDKSSHFPSVDKGTVSEATHLGTWNKKASDGPFVKTVRSHLKGKVGIHSTRNCHCLSHLEELKVNLTWLFNYKQSWPSKKPLTAEGWKVANRLQSSNIWSYSLRPWRSNSSH